MGHYYISDLSLKSEKRKIKYTFKGVDVNLYSDLGVFSKERIDFGTNVLLNALDELEDVQSILDVGCGYGIIGICLAKKYMSKNILMIDVNSRCISLVNENIKNNNLHNASVLESNLYEKVDGTFDMIISNPPIRAGKAVVNNVVVEGYEHLNEGGSIWVVIQKKQGAPSLFKKMEEIFGNVDTVTKEKGYYIYKSTKK